MRFVGDGWLYYGFLVVGFPYLSSNSLWFSRVYWMCSWWMPWEAVVFLLLLGRPEAGANCVRGVETPLGWGVVSSREITAGRVVDQMEIQQLWRPKLGAAMAAMVVSTTVLVVLCGPQTCQGGACISASPWDFGPDCRKNMNANIYQG